MKKIILFIFVFVCLLPSVALANSLPFAFRGQAPSYEIVIQQNSPIGIEKERLTFTMVQPDGKDSMVDAVYTMKNTSNTTQSINMAFIYFGNGYNDANHQSNPKVSVDNQPIQISLNYGKPAKIKSEKSSPVNNYDDLQPIFNTLQKNPPDRYSSSDYAIVLTYTVDFEPHQIREVQVSYLAFSAYPYGHTATPQYSYSYLLSPAKHYKYFKDLEINIIPSFSYPYVLESSLPFERTANGLYTAKFSTLPSDNLHFVMFSSPQPTYIDSWDWFALSSFLLLILFAIEIIVAIIIPIVLSIRKRIRRKRNAMNNKK